MILIADSGATKTDWCFGNTLHDCQVVHTEGINPFHLTEEKIKQLLQESLLAQLPFPQEEVKAIFFYGAGCTLKKPASSPVYSPKHSLTQPSRWKVICLELPVHCASISRELPAY